MNNYKFRVNKDWLYIGYGTDGTIDMSDDFNINNLPTYIHKWNGTGWVIDEIKLADFKKQEIFNRLDELSALISKNNTRYKHRENWSEYNENYINEIKELESQLENL